jgi:hypothetical protein
MSCISNIGGSTATAAEFQQAASWPTEMKILYLNPTNDVAPTPELLVGRGYEAVPVTAREDALASIRKEHFDAVLIAQGIEQPETLEFTGKVQRTQPEALAFLFNDCGFELLAALESLGAPEKVNEKVN